MRVPESAVVGVVRLSGRQRPYLSEAAARRHVEARRLRPEPYGPPKKLRSDVTVAVERRHGWPVYTVAPREGEPRGCVVYAHGGAWVNEIAVQQWHLVAQVAAEAHTSVVVPIYPLVPEGTAESVVAGFVRIVEECRATHGDVALVGDSAGGQIALSTAFELRDRFGVRVPRTVLISPVLDLTLSNPRMTHVQPHDPWLAVPGLRSFAELWQGDLDPTDQRVSPLLARTLEGLGPITLFSGTRDILNPDAHGLVERARREGVDVAFHEGDALIHVYPLLPTAQGARARDVVVRDLAAAL